MKNFFRVVVAILAMLGVLFLILLFLPEDEEEGVESADLQEQTVTVQAEEPAAEEDNAPAEEGTSVAEAPAVATSSEATAAKTSTETPAASTPTDAPAAETPTETPASQAQVTSVQEPVAAESGKQTAEVVIPASEIPDDVLEFRTTTLDQKPVSQEIFSDYDLTVVLVWGTFCTPCIKEIGSYAKLYDELPGNVNLVGLLDDVYDGIDSNVAKANDILDNNDAKFINLRTSDDLYDDIIGRIQYVPSALFVDKEGHIVGEILDGVRFDGMKKRLDGYLK